MPPIIEQFVNADLVSLIILGVLGLLVIIQMYYYIRYYAAPLRNNRKRLKGKIIYSESKPPISIVICSQNDADSLEKSLPSLLKQKYPKFEVIVVNDGSTDESNLVLNTFSKQYDNLKVSFLPPKAKYMSRKKMCISIGIKAASYEHIVLVDADCQPDTQEWLSLIAKNYVPGIDMVLGYSRFKECSSLMSYDNLFYTMQYAGYAICGHPFRGTIRNISFLKSVYYSTNGYANHLNLESGEDDIFVQDAATPTNTRVVLEQNAAITCDREVSNESYRRMKEKRNDNHAFYKGGIKFSMWFERFSRLLFYPAAIASIALFAISQIWFGLGLSITLFLTRMITQMCVLHKNANLLKMEQHHLSSYIFEIFMPFYEFHLRTFGRIGRQKWQMWREYQG